MSLSHSENDSFHAFVARQIELGVAHLTLEDCLRQWRADRERAKTIATVQEAVADFQAGRYLPLDRTMQEIRETLGPITREATGMISLPASRNDRDILDEALGQKHGPNARRQRS